MREQQVHEAFFAWLKKLDLPYIHQSMARKSHLEKGWPDFTIMFMGHVLCIEVKTLKGKVSPIQAKCFERIRRNGNKVVVAHSLEMCIDACKDILLIGKPALKTRSRRTTVDTPVMAGCDTLQPKEKSGRGSSCRTESAAPLFIANILGNNWVCRGDPSPGGTVERVRRATAADLINTTLRA